MIAAPADATTVPPMSTHRGQAPTVPLAHSDDRLNPSARTAAIGRLKTSRVGRPFDVLIIGGGVVGAGAALDAATRGLSVALVEAGDLASGTSSRSSRLAHGGLRYLEQLEFRLVHEALTERGLLLTKLAPHLTSPLSFMFPTTRKGWELPYMGVGVNAYDVLSRIGSYGGTLPRPDVFSRRKVAAMSPGLRTDLMSGAVRYWDAQIDDARHTLALARSAAGYGATITTGTKVVGLLMQAGRVVGARVQEREGGTEIKVHARVVVSAAGVWSNELRKMAGAPGTGTVRQSKGVHLIVPRDAIACTGAVATRTPTSLMFLLPWGAHWIIGTTDTDFDGDLNHPSVEATDVDYILGQANRWLRKPLTRADVTGAYAGLRPLLSAGRCDTGPATLSREHGVFHPAPGLVLVAGGKYTTYRVMAADIIDAARDELTATGRLGVGNSVTANVPLTGAAGYAENLAHAEQTAAESGLSVPAVLALLGRHGDRIDDVLALIDADPALGRRLHPDADFLRAEAVIAVTHEGARSLTDVLTRRLRIAASTPRVAAAVAGGTARLIAPLLGWDEARARAETEKVWGSAAALQHAIAAA